MSQPTNSLRYYYDLFKSLLNRLDAPKTRVVLLKHYFLSIYKKSGGATESNVKQEEKVELLSDFLRKQNQNKGADDEFQNDIEGDFQYLDEYNNVIELFYFQSNGNLQSINTHFSKEIEGFDIELIFSQFKRFLNGLQKR
jgi:hypothetical protein